MDFYGVDVLGYLKYVCSYSWKFDHENSRLQLLRLLLDKIRSIRGQATYNWNFIGQ